jgi:ABC-type branched-subunit amino acid transport system substrate-binding protein
VVARAILSLACLGGAGCSLLLNTADRTQCQTNADCDGNSALRGRVCSSGFCVLDAPNPETVSADGGSGCVSTALCTQHNSGRASVCTVAGGPCVPWEIPECPSIGGGWQDPNRIVVGSLLPLHVLQGDKTVLEGPYTKRLLRAIDLGLEEFTSVVPSGLVVPGGPPRPLAVLHCDTNGDPDTARRLFQHLTDVVGAQAVIVGWDEDMVPIADLVAAKKTTVVCSDCLVPFPGLEALPTGWKILPSITNDAPLVAWRVRDLEARIKAVDPADVRVAVISEPYRVQRAFSDALLPRLVFNGNSASANKSNFLAIQTDDPRVVPAVDFDPVVSKILALAPQIIVVDMSSDFPAHLLGPIEAGWPAGAPRPYYVLTQLAYEATPYAGVIHTDELRARFSGTRPASNAALRSNIEGFEQRYERTYREPPDGTYSGYEAFYATAYAIAAASTQPLLDGPHVSVGFESLVAGPSIDVGSGALPDALRLLGRGTIDLRGLDTELDWNLTTHEITSDMAMFCFGKDAEGALTVDEATDVRYDPTTGQITGSYSCN